MDIDLYDIPLVIVGVVALFFIVIGVQYLRGSPGVVQSKSTRRFGSFQLFSRRIEEEVTNCLSETIDGVDVTSFGYEYTVHDVEYSGTTFHQPVVLFHSSELSLPIFELRPRVLMDKVLFGKRKDIDFDSHPDFSKSYYLRGNDESAIRHVFSSRVLDYFESHEGLSVEGRKERLLCYRSVLDTAVTPDEIKRFLDVGKSVFDLIRLKN